MKISVALATYQGDRFLERQLESIAAQTRAPDELVVGDDASSDATVKLVDAFAQRSALPVALHVNKERLGSARNFEAVVRRCTGDVIALADQDDVWHGSKLELLERALEERGADLVFSDCELVDASGRPLGTTGWSSVRFTSHDRRAMERGGAFRTLVERQHRIGGTVTGATMAFRARHRDLVLPFPEFLPASGKGLLHDAWIALLVAAVAPIETIPALLVQHRQHPGQQIGMAPGARPGATGDRRRPQPGPASFASATQWLGALHCRLLTAVASERRDDSIALLERWMRHFEMRAGLSPHRLRRVGPIVRELATGRYHACSSGIRSAARDLVA